MKKTLITSAVLLLATSSLAFAGVPALDITSVLKGSPATAAIQLVRNGGDDNGGGDNGGGGSSSDDNGGDDHGGGNSGHDANDDDGDDDGGKGRGRGRGRGGDRDDDDSASNDDSNDDSPASGSNRRKPRVPGGSGCDDAGDIAEHAECRP